MIPYKCKVCDQEASIAFHCEHYGWFYFCSAHADAIYDPSYPRAEKKLILTDQDEEDLMWRSLPRGEDR
jgi:hypothetical protein